MWWANAGISMSQLPSSPHLDYFTSLLLLGGQMTSPHLPLYESPFPQSGFTPRISKNKVSPPPGTRPPIVRHLSPGMEEALLIRRQTLRNFRRRHTLAMHSEGGKVFFVITRRSLRTSSWSEPEVSSHVHNIISLNFSVYQLH